MIKIKNINLCGIRGVKSDCSIDLDGKSILIFGESGTGKSSISDVLEWFHNDRVEHLLDGEITRAGMLEALRNVSLNDTSKSLVSIEFSNPVLNSEKSILLRKDSLVSEYSNKSQDFITLLKEIQKETFILRHEDLTGFVLSTKSQKLDYFSAIIGFSEVTRIRSVLKKAVNEVKKTINYKNYENLINTQQSHLVEHLGENIISESQFLKSVNLLIKPLKIGCEVNNFGDVDNVLELIKTPDNSEKIDLQSFYIKLGDLISDLENRTGEIKALYKSYHDQYYKILSDTDKFQKIMLSNLLTEGQKILQNNIYKEEACPLCLQPKDLKELLNEIKIRLEELEAFKKEKIKLEEAKASLNNKYDNFYPLLNSLLRDPKLNVSENKTLKEMTQKLEKQLSEYLAQLKADVLNMDEIKNPIELDVDKDLLNKIKELASEKYNSIKSSMGNALIVENSTKIHFSKVAYMEILRLKKEKEILDSQLSSLRLIYSEFVKRQQDSLNSFLDFFSNDINSLYQFMNPGEKVEGIKFIPLEKDDELTGITLKMQFFDNEVQPPHKFLSESHLNCLGISFFLTAAKAFNKNIGFLILDDVISSFDSNHRSRFADLLIDKFSDYQIVLLTHEKHWFEYVRNAVKSKNWIVRSIKWNDEKGTHLDEPPEKSKDRIEFKIKNNTEDGLGNDIRKYLEFLLKQIAANLKINVEFRFNDENEDRMAYELLTCLISELNKQPSDLKTQSVIKRLLTSLFIGTKDSHDSSFKPKMGDFKAFWADVEELENLFYCDSCNKCVSLKYYDKTSKKIKCSCQNGKSYDWKI